MSDKAVSIRCQATINDEERYVSGFTAQIGIGNFWPVLYVETHPKKDAENLALQLSSSDASQEMGKVQSAMFEERTFPDCILHASVEGGDGGSFDFRGLLIGGTFSFHAGSVSQEDAAIPDYAAVSAANYSLYKWNGPAANQHVGEPSITKEGTLSKFIKACMDTLYKSWPQCCMYKKSTIEYKVAERQHQLNGQVKRFAEQLLQESEETIGWKEAIELMKNPSKGVSDRELRQRVIDVLTASSGPFETVIMQLAEEFQCIYVPEWTKIGKFKNKGDLLKEKESLSVDVISTMIQTSNGDSFFPIRYVAVCPPAKAAMNCREDLVNFVAAPEDGVKMGGSMLRSPGPQWISGPIAPQKVEKSGNEAPRRKPRCKVSSAKKVPQEAQANEKDYIKNVYDVLKKWAENEYVYQALSGSTVRLTVPLNFKVELGKCYQVKNKKSGQLLLTGLLEHVSHSVSTGDGKNPQAYTVLQFGVVQLPGFELPGAS